MTRPLRVGLDLRLGREAWLGGVYYLQNLALAVRTLDPEDRPEFVALAPIDDPGIAVERFQRLLPVVPFRGGDPSGRLNARVGNRVRRFLRRDGDFSFAHAARAAEVDILFPTRRAPAGAPTLLPWIYDLQHIDWPELFSARERSRRTREFRRAARSAQILVLSSQVMANAFLARFPEAAGKVRVLQFTTVLDDGWLAADPADARERYDLPPRFLLLPGQLWAHKDHGTAFAAIHWLRDAGHPVILACTGATTDYRNPRYLARLRGLLNQTGLTDHVRILGVVPREDYVQLIRAAALVVQPSRYEGWSSVVEDARALGKRMVLSDIAVHREQAPHGALYFRAGDSRDLAARIIEGLEQPPALREREALAEQADRVKDYARTFASIAREAAAAD